MDYEELRNEDVRREPFYKIAGIVGSIGALGAGVSLVSMFTEGPSELSSLGVIYGAAFALSAFWCRRRLVSSQDRFEDSMQEMDRVDEVIQELKTRIYQD